MSQSQIPPNPVARDAESLHCILKHMGQAFVALNCAWGKVWLLAALHFLGATLAKVLAPEALVGSILGGGKGGGKGGGRTEKEKIQAEIGVKACLRHPWIM
eukprot:204914-Amphidinium_carterae.1